jgi:hypothetical protein
MRLLQFSTDLILPAALCPRDRLRLWTKQVPWILPRLQEGLAARKADVSQPCVPPRPVTGIAFPLHYIRLYVFIIHISCVPKFHCAYLLFRDCTKNGGSENGSLALPPVILLYGVTSVILHLCRLVIFHVERREIRFPMWGIRFPECNARVLKR